MSNMDTLDITQWRPIYFNSENDAINFIQFAPVTINPIITNALIFFRDTKKYTRVILSLNKHIYAYFESNADASKFCQEAGCSFKEIISVQHVGDLHQVLFK